jgi:hypothetical protein
VAEQALGPDAVKKAKSRVEEISLEIKRFNSRINLE